jgi:GDP-L-fucose synthase
VNRSSRIYVAGADTLIGVALTERLRAAGCCTLVGAPPDGPDLTVAAQVEDFFGEARPEYVFLAAGRSGGIRLNQTRPADLMLHNLLVTAQVLDSAHRHGVEKLVYLASSCCYPKHAPQPLRVESLMAGPLEPTNAAYATAKLAGWQLCDAYRRQHGAPFITAIPANAYGPHDDFSHEGGHVIPALIRRAHEAKLRDEPELTVWGTGTPRREFIFARDLADAAVFVMDCYDGPEPINLGGGADLSIAEAAHLVAGAVGYRGRIRFDASQPDGMPLKMLDAGPLRSLGWRLSVDFPTGLAETYEWFLGTCHLPVVRKALPL